MKILFLEDRFSVFDSLKEKLTSDGNTIFKATQVSDAISILQEEVLDLFIIDLRVSPIGLKPEEIMKLPNGRISGWVFLENYVFLKDNENKSKTVIYSEYISELEKVIKLSNYPEIRFFSKRDYSIENIRNYVQLIKNKK